MGTVIVLDVGCNVPEGHTEADITKYGCKVFWAGSSILLGNVMYQDGIDPEIGVAELLRKSQNTGYYPKTTAPSSGVYEKVFESANATDHVLCLVLPKTLSTAHQNAKIAAARFKNVTIIETPTTSAGIWWLALQFAKDSSEVEFSRAVEKVKANSKKLTSFLYVSKLGYLREGGRAAVALAKIIGLLNSGLLMKLGRGGLKGIERVGAGRVAQDHLLGLIEKGHQSIEEVFLVHNDEPGILSFMEAGLKRLGIRYTKCITNLSIAAHTGSKAFGVILVSK